MSICLFLGCYPSHTFNERSPDPSIPLKLEATFASIHANIIAPKCVVCHRSGGKAHEVLLDSPQEMIDSALEIVVPGVPEMSGLIIVVKDGARKKMPPLKSGITPLNEDEIQVIADWITNGAKD